MLVRVVLEWVWLLSRSSSILFLIVLITAELKPDHDAGWRCHLPAR
jgi:hypothetical protein